MYKPLSSVWEGNDQTLIEAMLTFYPATPVQVILDATYNAGRFWKDSPRKQQVIGMDIDARHKPQILCDNRKMPSAFTNWFDAVIYDPPHVGPQGRAKSKKRFDIDFGATVETVNGSLSHLYPPFLAEAKRVLKPEGILLAKITDIVNNHRSQWAHVDFMHWAAVLGFTVCDLIIKVRKGPMVSSKWQNAHHARKRHCFWIVCRNGKSCEK